MKRYMIAAMARSGTNLFCDYLTNASLGAPTEFFNPQYFPLHQRKVNEVGAVKAAELLEEDRTVNGVFGMKVNSLQYFRLREAVLADTHRRFVDADLVFYMKRDDLLAQAVSYARACQDGNFARFPKTPEIKDSDYRFKRIQIHTHVKLFAAYELIWATYFERAGIEPLVLRYETLVGKLDNTITLTTKLLDVEPIYKNGKVRIQQRNHISNQWIEEYLKYYKQTKEECNLMNRGITMEQIIKYSHKRNFLGGRLREALVFLHDVTKLISSQTSYRNSLSQILATPRRQKAKLRAEQEL